MVFVYALLGVSACRETADGVLRTLDAIVVPGSFHAEFANVVWQWARHDHITPDAGREALEDAAALVTRTFPVTDLNAEALALAVEADHPVYDTLFVAAALREGTRVITFDRRLHKAFPDHVVLAEG